MVVRYFPLTLLCESNRAAVIMGVVIPSPTKRMTFLAVLRKGSACARVNDSVSNVPLLGHGNDGPSSGGGGSSVVSESCDVFSDLVEGDVSVRLGEDVDIGRELRILGEKVLKATIVKVSNEVKN